MLSLGRFCLLASGLFIFCKYSVPVNKQPAGKATVPPQRRGVWPVLFLKSSFFRPAASPSLQITLSLSPSYTRGLHSRRSSLAHVNEGKFYLETWPLVTAQCHIIRQRLTSICLEWAFSYFRVQTRGNFHPHAGFRLLLCKPNSCKWELHGGGGKSVCLEDGRGRLCGRRSPRM